MTWNKTRRIPELDGLRGIAIAMVLFWHYFVIIAVTKSGSLLSYIQASGRLAWTGVDLFFVLSGFLIGGILIDGHDATNYFRVFYTRRFYRIMPLYAVCLSGTYFFIPIVRGLRAGLGHGPIWMENPIPWYSYVLFLQNFWIAAKGDFGQPALRVAWSLAVEEQFYLTLPLVIRYFNGRRRVFIIFTGIVAASAIRVLLYLVWRDKTAATYVLMPCRADALLLGVVGALIVRNAHWLKKVEQNRSLMLVSIGVLGIGAVVLTALHSLASQLRFITFGFTWMAAFYLCIILYALTQPSSWLSQFLRWRWIGWLGTIAYGTYLFHMYILDIVSRLVFPRYWNELFYLDSAANYGVMFACLSLTILFCWISWLYFERPLIHLGHRTRYEFGNPSTLDAEEAVSANRV